ncbi:PilX N-terminal domain-containing pilus assembly protein [Oceanimonas baumannii]|uniref:PilX N-terminal domain-containing pilus assembly protein n=1 Tax=Oceanimonas baumannii TaxID=129578 RepID=UPI003A8DE6B2
MMATNRQKGFATLVITLVLVSMLVAVSVFIGKVLISDKRITLNEIEYRVALAAAEKGIAEAMAQLEVNPAASSAAGTLVTSSATASYTVTMTPGVPISAAWQLESVATLANGSNTTVSVQVAERKILNEQNVKRAVPLMLAGNLPTSGNITIVAHPNGGGPGIPVSIWSKGAATLSGNAKTCSLQAYQDGCSESNAYSTTVNVGEDIVTHDVDNFPGNLVEYLFGVPDTSTGWGYIESSATAVLTSCSGAAINDGGFYIIKGVPTCIIESSLGVSEPVVIILKDSNLTINGNHSIYGVLFAYDSDLSGASNFSIKVNGNARFYGAMMSNYNTVDLPTGNYDAIYDPDVISRLTASEADNSFTNLNIIPGSWKDW